MMKLIRHSLRKARQDGVRPLVSKALEKVVREEIIRWYIDQHVDYYQDVVDFASLLESGELVNIRGASNPNRQIPLKKSVSPTDKISGLPSVGIVPQQCGILNNAIVLSPSGLIQLPGGKYISDSVGPPHLASRRVSVALSMNIYHHSMHSFQNSITNSPKNNRQNKIDRGVSLMPLWSNYFHWTVETLPKLYWFERYQDIFSKAKILLPANTSSWMMESLSILGFEESDLIRVNSSITNVDELLLPSKIEPIPEYANWMRDRALDSIKHPKENSRVYISRKNATKRRVLNDNEVISKLRTRGFKPYVLEELTVKDQIRLFANAEVVVGPHGAGFANLIYAENPCVIELFGNKRLNTYHRLCELLHLDYEAIYCEADGEDLVVDMSKLLAKVDDVINS